MDNQSKMNGASPLAIVTGASSGIGYELAKVFATSGYDLLIASKGEGINAAAKQLRELGHQVEAIQVDLATFDGVEDLYAKIKNLGRPIDSVAINAGVGVGGEFLTNDFEEEMNCINLNVISVVHLAKKILPDLMAQGSGRILFTSSIAATMPGPYYAVYAATKAFVQSFAEALRFELKDSGIHITALQPGATDTKFFQRAHMQDTPVAKREKDDPAEVAQAGYDALMDDDDHVVAGSLMNKLQAVLAKFATPQQSAALHSRESKPDHRQVQ